MQELAGKTAFVTGGASGIGLALGHAFAEAGMQVMLADIETGALAAEVKSLHNFGPDVRGVTCDVTDPESVERAAAASFEAFGNVHVVCNNAGVAGGSGIDDILLDDWRWVLDVNLMVCCTVSARSCRTSAPMAKAATSSTRPPWRGWSAGSGSARIRRASSPS
jgi:NAD(P)-dependent dehydrogenase (short-subunit alcohol dehydrogenase family)